MESDLEAAIRNVNEIFQRTSDKIAAELAANGLTHGTAQLLAVIDPSSEPPSMKDLAERLFCNSPNATFLTDQLENKGLVMRVVDPADRRSRVVLLTDDGVRLRQVVIAHTLQESPLSDLSAEDLHDLAAILRKVTAAGSMK